MAKHTANGKDGIRMEKKSEKENLRKVQASWWDGMKMEPMKEKRHLKMEKDTGHGNIGTKMEIKKEKNHIETTD